MYASILIGSGQHCTIFRKQSVSC